ncbi:hypothetical protein GPECTOR_558g578 [Gonium pectorale]|uniref:Protein kinase domain-containing protein n=1 Tax=Gonium pectorale TaxID=33097 RepID=A0A150FUP5_GONPE|nr:hypothetical protein GPECTOR_558g578 [Gonium pectorale]|eukprot:KXZ41317.1 hypothetical protein GPECTOR_558g578 [Gonium pectorale]
MAAARAGAFRQRPPLAERPAEQPPAAAPADAPASATPAAAAAAATEVASPWDSMAAAAARNGPTAPPPAGSSALPAAGSSGASGSAAAAAALGGDSTGSSTTVPPALVPLYTSLLEVALAVRHMHGRRLIHGDLKSANVLLKSSSCDPRGWTCKLSDLGCARLLSEEEMSAGGVRQPNPSGTLPYMAPELLSQGGLQGPHTDVYAFGIMMWELLHGTPPYLRMNPAVLPAMVVRQGLRPAFSSGAPPEYV